MRPLLLLAFAGAQAATFAQWTTPDLNTTVRAGAGNDASSMLATYGPDGSTYSCWFEMADGNYQLRMQRLSSAGVRLWDDAGLIVSDHPQNSALFRYDLKTDHDGNAVVAFQDERTGALDIVAYKIGPDGSFLWGADGIELPTPGSTGLSPVIGVLANNDVIIAWNADGTPGHISFAKVTAAGDVPAVPNTGISSTTRVSRPKLVPSGTGFILQFVQEGATFLTPGTMYAMRFDADVLPVWDARKIVSSKTISGFYFPEPASDGHDGFYMAFNTSNPANASLTDVYVQRMRGDGSTWSEEGTRADVGGDIQKFTAGKAIAPVNDLVGISIPLQITNTAQSQSGIALQLMDTAGFVQNGEHAPVVVPLGTTTLSDFSATENSVMLVHGSGNFGQVHLACSQVTLSGPPVVGPFDLSTVNSNKEDVQLTPFVGGQAVAVWQDDRAISGIYAQRVEGSVTGIAESPAAQGLRLESNPSRTPVILCGQALPAGTNIRLCDVQGRTIVRQGNVPSGTRVGLAVPEVTNGLYTIVVENGQGRSVLRWVKE